MRAFLKRAFRTPAARFAGRVVLAGVGGAVIYVRTTPGTDWKTIAVGAVSAAAWAIAEYVLPVNATSGFLKQ